MWPFLKSTQPIKKATDLYIQEFLKFVIKQGKLNLRYCSVHPHMTEQKHDQKISDWILGQVFKKTMDDTEENSYKVLLSIPDEDVGNMVELSGTTGKYKHGKISKYTQDVRKLYSKYFFLEAILKSPSNEQRDEHVFPPFIAYSSATTTGTGTSGIIESIESVDPIYVNYGRLEDYKRYKTIKKLNILDKNSINKDIHIIRYGKIPASEKVKNAIENGAKGVILYPDWDDPNKKLVIRESILGNIGDPQTPGWPTLPHNHLYKLKVTEDVSFSLSRANLLFLKSDSLFLCTYLYFRHFLSKYLILNWLNLLCPFQIFQSIPLVFQMPK